MLKKLEERRVKIVNERKAKGLGFLGPVALAKMVPGSKPLATKKSKRDSKRPLVLTKCVETKKRFLQWYFAIFDAFKNASEKYRKGMINVELPPGTYQPPLCLVPG